MQQRQDDIMEKLKTRFNIGFNLCLWHQRCIVVPWRSLWGQQALGTSCAFAFVLMFFWAAFSRDVFMYAWLGLWTLCYLYRKAEAAKLVKSGARVHSWYDGWPDTIRIGRTERTAKLIVEPVLIFFFGVSLYWIYEQMGMSPYGLPYFMLLGGATLHVVEQVKQQIWQRKIMGMTDARLEQESLVRDLRDRYGDS